MPFPHRTKFENQGNELFIVSELPGFSFPSCVIEIEMSLPALAMGNLNLGGEGDLFIAHRTALPTRNLSRIPAPQCLSRFMQVLVLCFG